MNKMAAGKEYLDKSLERKVKHWRPFLRGVVHRNLKAAFELMV